MCTALPQDLAAADEVAPRQVRILVVDDNQDDAELLTLLLRLNGYEVQAANDGVAALEIAGVFDPDVVLLDIGLPRLDGYAVARQLRHMSPRRRCLIAVTGYGAEDDRMRARAAGFDCHIVKPLEPARLNELIAQSVSSLGL